MYCYCSRNYPWISAEPDYPKAKWIPANPNGYQVANRPHDYSIDKIIIHTMQGYYEGTIATFQNPSSQVSAHYIISKEGDIGQMVQEKDIAYQAGNWGYNEHTVGIEHEGFIDKPEFYTDAMYNASAKVTAYLAKKYHIPVDRAHIIGHFEVPDQSHTDPGKYWDWDKYMELVKKYYNEEHAKAKNAVHMLNYWRY